MMCQPLLSKANATSAPAEAVRLAASLRLAVMRLARRLRELADVGVKLSMLSALSTVERMGRQLLDRNLSRKTAYLAKRLRSLTSEEREVIGRAVGLLERFVSEER